MEIRACIKTLSRTLTPGEARLVWREAFEDAVGRHRERLLLLLFARIQRFQFDLLPNFEGLPDLPCKEQKYTHDDTREVCPERHPLIPEPRHAVHTHTREPVVTLSRSREAVRSWDSVHGSQTQGAIAIGGQPVVDWCLPLCKRAGTQTCRCGFFRRIVCFTRWHQHVFSLPLVLFSPSRLSLSRRSLVPREPWPVADLVCGCGGPQKKLLP